MDRPHQSSPSDPHRRLQRHTYQEGPGFLFLATPLVTYARGGGTGCSLNASTTGKAGGAGATGVVIVTEYYLGVAAGVTTQVQSCSSLQWRWRERG
jgi:hypothetical protein